MTKEKLSLKKLITSILQPYQRSKKLTFILITIFVFSLLIPFPSIIVFGLIISILAQIIFRSVKKGGRKRCDVLLVGLYVWSVLTVLCLIMYSSWLFFQSKQLTFDVLGPVIELLTAVLLSFLVFAIGEG